MHRHRAILPQARKRRPPLSHLDHRVGDLGDHAGPLLGRENALDDLDIDEGHGCRPSASLRQDWRRAEPLRTPSSAPVQELNQAGTESELGRCVACA